MRVDDGRRHDGANGHFSKFCERALITIFQFLQEVLTKTAVFWKIYAVNFGRYVPTFRAVVTLPGLTKRESSDAAPLDGTYSPHVTVHTTTDLTRLGPQ